MNPLPTRPHRSFGGRLTSPDTGKPLVPVDDHFLSDGAQLWPVIEGIPYLRLGRESLRDEAVAALRAGDADEALAILLTDRKDESIPPVALKETRWVVKNDLSVKEAMAGLNFGGMIPYVYHRWCLPSYLSGLALLERHAPVGSTLFELGCGAGHFLRAWTLTGGRAVGADLVFSNLWLARRFIAPEADLVCFDANLPFPIESASADAALCHDAFHYFRNKAHVFTELQRIAGRGTVLLGHVHNAAAENLSPGWPLTHEEYRKMLAPNTVYDDRALTYASLGLSQSDEADLESSQAFAFVCGSAVTGSAERWTLPRPGTTLHVNPLLSRDGPCWPSDRFWKEYGEDWDYMKGMAFPAEHLVASGASGTWDRIPECDPLVQGRVLLDLPEGWIP